MAYSQNSDTLRQHRTKLLEIALRHAAEGGLKSLNRARIASEAGVSIGVVSFAFGGRDAMLDLVMRTGTQRGLVLSYA